MIQIYGIKNCDTMKKAFRWLEENGVDYSFHDYKKELPSEAMAVEWITNLGWENIINKRGTTWRKLDDNTKESMDNKKAVDTIIQQPSMIKRPLLVKEGRILLGFKAEEYKEWLL